jgi:hypothetical protein
MDEHKRRDLCCGGPELCDTGLVLLQLVFVPTELFGAYGILLLERLDSFQDAVQLSNDGIEFLIQLLLHSLAHGFQDDICLLGEELLHLFFELTEFGF